MSIVSSKATITRKELESVLDCLISQKLEAGEAVKNFELQISNIVGIKYALAVNSLVSAYHLAFTAFNIKDTDEVIIPSFFEPAPLSALRLCGGKPVIVDIFDNSFFPSLEQIKEKINPNTKAIVIGHTMGFFAPVEQIKDLGIPILEDISHIIGAEYNEKPAGQDGAITLSSFAPSMIITTGNGAMVMSSNSQYYSTMRDGRGNNNHGTNLNFDYTITDFQGAMGLSQIYRLQDFIKRRRNIARIYHDALKTTPHKTLYAYSESFTYQAFPVIFDAPADRVEKYWKKCGIEIFKPIGVPAHALLNYKPLDYPNSERLAKKIYSLPIYPTLSKKEIEKIASSLAKFL